MIHQAVPNEAILRERADRKQHSTDLTWVNADEAATAYQREGSGTTDGSDQGSQHLGQGLSLGQTRADEQSQTPQALSLSSSPPVRWATFKRDLELTLKLFLKDRVVLGGTQ